MKKAIMLAALATVISMPAMANDPAKMEKKADMWFAKMDTNSDGKVSKAEHDKFGNDMFAKADANSDGNLTKEELKEQKMKEKEEMKEKM